MSDTSGLLGGERVSLQVVYGAVDRASAAHRTMRYLFFLACLRFLSSRCA